MTAMGVHEPEVNTPLRYPLEANSWTGSPASPTRSPPGQTDYRQAMHLCALTSLMAVLDRITAAVQIGCHRQFQWLAVAEWHRFKSTQAYNFRYTELIS